MKCIKCIEQLDAEYRSCLDCKHPTSIYSDIGNNKFINVGNNNINIGAGNNSIQQIYITSDKKVDDTVVKYERHKGKRIIGGIEGYKRKAKISGFLSLISSLITIIEFLEEGTISYLLIISFASLAYAINSRKTYDNLRNDGIAYKKNKAVLTYEKGKVYTVSEYGHCPECNGRVYIYFDEKHKKDLGKCEIFESHLYTYDRKTNAGAPFKVDTLRLRE